MKAYQRGPREFLRFIWNYYRGLTLLAGGLGLIVIANFIFVFIYLAGKL